MNETMMHIRLLLRSELMLARSNADRLMSQSKLLIVALGLILITVTMVNVGAYDLLAERYGNANAAFLIAGANAVLAVGLILAASRMQPGKEEEMVREIREFALAELSADAEGIKQDLNQVKDNVERIRTGLSGGGGGIASAASLAPIAGMVIGALKRRRNQNS